MRASTTSPKPGAGLRTELLARVSRWAEHPRGLLQSREGSQGASLRCLKTRPADIFFFLRFLLFSMSPCCLILSCAMSSSGSKSRASSLFFLSPCEGGRHASHCGEGGLTGSCPCGSLDWISSTTSCFDCFLRLIKVYAAL